MVKVRFSMTIFILFILLFSNYPAFSENVNSVDVKSLFDNFKNESNKADYRLVNILDGNENEYKVYRSVIKTLYDRFELGVKPVGKLDLFDSAALDGAKIILDNKMFLSKSIYNISNKGFFNNQILMLKKAEFVKRVLNKLHIMSNSQTINLEISTILINKIGEKVKKNSLQVEGKKSGSIYYVLDVAAHKDLSNIKEILIYHVDKRNITVIDNPFKKIVHESGSNFVGPPKASTQSKSLEFQSAIDSSMPTPPGAPYTEAASYSKEEISQAVKAVNDFNMKSEDKKKCPENEAYLKGSGTIEVCDDKFFKY